MDVISEKSEKDTNNCSYCGKETEWIVKGFCRLCYQRNHNWGTPNTDGKLHKKIAKICPVCGVSFIPKRKEHKTCSYKCGCKIRKPYIHKNKKCEVRCAKCGGVKFVKESIKNKQTHFFCSNSCYYQYKKIKSIGELNPNFKNAKKRKICPTCGNWFEYYDKIRVYCSHKCAKTSNLKNKGTRFERKAKDDLESEGFCVTRSSGSFGAHDLVAFNQDYFRLIQVKSTINNKINCLSYYGDDLLRLSNLSCPIKTIKELWCWKSRIGWEKFYLDDNTKKWGKK